MSYDAIRHTTLVVKSLEYFILGGEGGGGRENGCPKNGCPDGCPYLWAPIPPFWVEWVPKDQSKKYGGLTNVTYILIKRY